MATGIVKGEKLGTDALLADNARTEPNPLPGTKETVFLNYPNKISDEEIFQKLHHSYVEVGRDTNSTVISNINANAFILADNFYGLNQLLDCYRNKIQLIYFDPPYGTGREFQSRGLKHAYKDILGTAPWLEFIRRRLIIMRELLSDNGTIYVHIGYQMLFHLKIIMDEVLGEENFLNMIVRKKCSSKNYTRNQYPNLNDYILFYSKSKNYIWNKPGLGATEEWIEKEYPKHDEKGQYKLVPIHAPGVRNGETGKPWKGMMPPPGKHWQLTPSKLDELDEKNEIHWSKNGNPRRKVYLTNDKMLPLTDYWDQYRDAHHQSIKITGYPTEKNLDMLKKIVEASSNEGDVVLDPFCGSGTTLQAAGELNRQWIGIDQSFTAAEATLKRMRNGLDEMGDYVNGNKNKPKQIELFEKTKKHEFKFIVDADVMKKHTNEVNELASI